MCRVLLLRPTGKAASNSGFAPDQFPAYKIGSDDLLSVSVYDAPELSKMVRVSSDGYVRLPMLKSRIKVVGAMPAQVEGAIIEELEREEILVGRS